METEKATIHLTATVNGELHEAFMQAVEDMGGSKADVVREALILWLHENEYLF